MTSAPILCLLDEVLGILARRSMRRDTDHQTHLPSTVRDYRLHQLYYIERLTYS